MTDETQESAAHITLMSTDEVYLYKIPPLKNAAGHRAEDWNLESPLKTCSMKVEQIGNVLAVSFIAPENSAVFAASKIDLTQEGTSMAGWYEQVVDSSRYFTIKIQNADGREATIGFGFRERDQAIDMREAFNHYEKQTLREQELKEHHIDTSIIPTLKEGEKIHVNVAGRAHKAPDKPKKAAGSGGGFPLLKKPPPPANS